MLLFLKHLKFDAISTSKPVKYLAYALGEIFLVVVGILIALEVSHFDSENNNRQLESQYYQSMKVQLLEDKQILLEQIAYNAIYKDKFAQAINIIISDDRSKSNELGQIVTQLIKFSDFRRRSSIYQTLIYSGDIKLIKNQKTIEFLQLIEGEYSYIERLEDVHRQAVLTDVLALIVEVVQLKPFKVIKPELLFSYQMSNTFVLIEGLIMEKDGIYKKSIDEIDKGIVILDKVLLSI